MGGRRGRCREPGQGWGWFNLPVLFSCSKMPKNVWEAGWQRVNSFNPAEVMGPTSLLVQTGAVPAKKCWPITSGLLVAEQAGSVLHSAPSLPKTALSGGRSECRFPTCWCCSLPCPVLDPLPCLLRSSRSPDASPAPTTMVLLWGSSASQTGYVDGAARSNCCRCNQEPGRESSL